MATKYLQSRPEVEKTLRENNIFVDDDEDIQRLSYKQRSHYWRISTASANIYDVSRWRESLGGMTLFNVRSARLLARTIPEPFDFTHSLREADIPITIIGGDHDYGNFEALSYEDLYRTIIDSAAVDIPENIFPSLSEYKAEIPRLQVHIIKNAGHNPWIDQPGEVNRLLLQGLSRK